MTAGRSRVPVAAAGRRIAALVGLGSGTLALGALAVDLLPRAVPLTRVLGVLAIAALAVAAVGCLSLPWAWHRVLRTVPLRAVAPLRGLLHVGLATLLLSWWVIVPFSQVGTGLGLAVALGVWSLLLAWSPAGGRGTWLLEKVSLAALATLVLLELSLRLLGAVGIASALIQDATSPAQVVRANLLRPGQPVFGAVANRQGFHDEDFPAPGQGKRPSIAMIGDSFAVGIVPHSYLFATVAEQRLGVPVHNLGVRAIGVPEYRWLLDHVALPLEPDLVVLCLFLGNDLPLPPPPEGGGSQGLRIFDPGSSATCRIVARAVTLLREGRPGLAQAQDQPLGDEDLLAAFPWLVDWRLEPPTMSPEHYGGLKRRIVTRLGDPGRCDYAALFAHLSAMRAACGAGPFAVVLIADELQVERAPWAEWRMESAVAEAGWDLPQQRIVAFCQQRGIPCLDLSPVLRAAAVEDDGRLHLYHLRDTHFNAKGNRIAGEAMAAFLRPLLPRR